jgi:FkbM family methyltransferase
MTQSYLRFSNFKHKIGRNILSVLYWIGSKNPQFGNLILSLWYQMHIVFECSPHPGFIWVADRLNYRFPIETKLFNSMRIKVNWNDLGVGFKIYQNGIYEKNTVQIISQILKPGDIFMDVGAHCGQYTLIASSSVGATGQVHSFEPDPETFKLLSENVKLNNLANVYVNELALSSQEGIRTLYFASSHCTGASSLSTPYTYSDVNCEVKCTTFDSYIHQNKFEEVDVLKIDIEGHEIEALKGGNLLLSSKNRPIIIAEFSEQTQNYFGYTCKDLARFLVDRTYQLYIIGDELPFNVLAIPEDQKNLIDDLTIEDFVLKPYNLDQET